MHKSSNIYEYLHGKISEEYIKGIMYIFDILNLFYSDIVDKEDVSRMYIKLLRFYNEEAIVEDMENEFILVS